MTPEQFVQRVQKGPLAPAYLFLGPEAYGRRLCKEALVGRALPEALRAEGMSHFDLENVTLANVLDDARSLSLFATERLIWVSSAELALPRRLTSGAEEDAGGERGGEALIAEYIRAPTAGTVVIFDCCRYDFQGDDRAKLERVQKFYAAVPAVVEFRPYTPESSRFLAQQLAKQYGLKVGKAELALLLEVVGGDANRLALELEKLSLYVGTGRAVTREDLEALVPNASQSTIFSLVNALGRRDRQQALRSLDILIREGEYLPLALTFLSTQFRLALAAKEERVGSAQQAVTFFAKLGVRMWRERAEQVVATANAFSMKQLNTAVALIYETDKKFREGYRDDRVVMETLVFGMTG